MILLVFLAGLFLVNGFITCNTGYGQRGLLYEDGIAWVHTCPASDYCFEVVTSGILYHLLNYFLISHTLIVINSIIDIEIMKSLIVFPWDPYFYQYYIRGCGGDWGMPLDYHPCKGKPISCRYLGNIKANITVPVVLTGEGITQFTLSYFPKLTLLLTNYRWY